MYGSKDLNQFVSPFAKMVELPENEHRIKIKLLLLRLDGVLGLLILLHIRIIQINAALEYIYELLLGIKSVIPQIGIII
jgi:hypothetical protein